jgi:hypothetical protein
MDGEVGSLEAIAKRGKLHKPEIRGMEAALAKMEADQATTPNEERAKQISETKELLDRLNGKHGKEAAEVAHRSIAEACKRQLDIKGRAAKAGGTALGIGIIAIVAMEIIRGSQPDSTAPYQRPTITPGA